MKLHDLGLRLKQARKSHYPKDTLESFALRIGVSRATYQKMEQGDLSVTLEKYYTAAKLLELSDSFDTLFKQKERLFDD